MKSPIVIHLNGTVINGRIDGVESFEITQRENDDDGGLVKSYSSELKFYDDGYSLIRPILVDNANGFSNSIDVQIFDECCGRLVFDGLITGDKIDWCEPECWISANVVEKKPGLNCVKSKLLYDNQNGFLNNQQKKVRYCVDVRPNFILSVLLLIYAILNLLIYAVILPLSLVVVVIQSIAFVICQIVCAIPGTPCNSATCTGGTWTNPQNSFSEITGWLTDMQNRLIQCQWYHPTALVRDYVKNVCDICGLQFQSSILNDPSSPYFNLLLFSAPIRKGYKPSETNGLLISENLPIETLDTLMTKYLKPMFNAKYWIVGNKLIFERKDYFVGTSTWIDSEQMLNDGRIIENQICFSYIDRERPSFGEYNYSLDGMDLTGNEAFERYDEIVEWNPFPISPTQSGSINLVLLSSMARFRDDAAGVDTLGGFESGVYNTLFGGAIANSRDILLMNQHNAFNYKFMIWNPSSGLENARVERSYSNSFTGGPVVGNYFEPALGGELVIENVPLDENKLFNYPMFFNENNTNNLYSLFHYIDNPRLPGTKIFNFNFSFSFDCGELDAIDFSKTIRIRVGNTIKFGEIKELKIDFVKRTIGVSGIV